MKDYQAGFLPYILEWYTMYLLKVARQDLPAHLAYLLFMESPRVKGDCSMKCKPLKLLKRHFLKSSQSH